MATFIDNFNGAISAYWKQYGGNATANGTNVTSPSNGSTAWRLIYDIGDQMSDGDIVAQVVTTGGGTSLQGVMGRWQGFDPTQPGSVARTGDDNGNVTYAGYLSVFNVTTGTIQLVRVDSAASSTVLEDTAVAMADGDTIGLRMLGTSIRCLKNAVAIGTGKTDAAYASGGMGIFDFNGSTYDTFSGPTNSTTAADAWLATHSDGSTTKYQSLLSTDRARGKALLDAQAAAVAGDTITDVSAAGTHDLGSVGLNPTAGTVGTANLLVKVIGRGKLATTVYCQSLSSGACITPNSNQEFRSFTIWCNTGNLNGSPLGHRGSVPSTNSYSNVLFSDLRGIGPVDCLHTTAGGTKVVNFRCVRCDFNSAFDTAIIVDNSCAAGSTAELVNCTAVAQFGRTDGLQPINSGAGQICRGVSSQDTDMVLTVYGGTYFAGGAVNSTPVNSAALVTLGTLSIFGATLTSSGTNALDLQQTGGTLNVGNTTVYNVGKTAGSITSVGNAYVPAPPTDLVAKVGSFGAVDLSWTRNSTNETNFQVDYATNAIFTLNTGSKAVAAGTIAASIPGLTLRTVYYFRVKGVNATGNSTLSNLASIAPIFAGGGGGGRVSARGAGGRVGRMDRT